MSAELQTALAAVRDIDGVIGSFLIDLQGRVLARDLPVAVTPAALASASVHLARLRDALESDGSVFESCVARFGPHLLLLRAVSEATLCVACPRGTNLAAVQMGTTLFMRHLQVAADVSNEAADATTTSDSAPRLFRGRPV